jgi:hypothetical protein
VLADEILRVENQPIDSISIGETMVVIWPNCIVQQSQMTVKPVPFAS